MAGRPKTDIQPDLTKGIPSQFVEQGDEQIIQPNNQNEQLKEKAQTVFNQKTALIETVKLPTRGLVPNIPGEITIRALQRKDKKKVLMTEVDDILLALLQHVLVEPQNFNIYNLLPFETKYLLYRLRVLTYGNQHTFKDRCPYCSNVNDVELDLNILDVKEVPDSFKTLFDIGPLPVSGTILKCKLLTEGERAEITKRAKELKDATGNDAVEMDMLWEARVVAINNDSKLAPVEITQFLDELTDYDSEWFMEYYYKYEGNYGLQTKLNYNCDECKGRVESEMPSIYTFFRPTFKINIAE